NKKAAYLCGLFIAIEFIYQSIFFCRPQYLPDFPAPSPPDKRQIFHADDQKNYPDFQANTHHLLILHAPLVYGFSAAFVAIADEVFLPNLPVLLDPKLPPTLLLEHQALPQAEAIRPAIDGRADSA